VGIVLRHHNAFVQATAAVAEEVEAAVAEAAVAEEVVPLFLRATYK